MAILIGVDEAGYGPHLGPLAVAATAWRVEPREEGDGGCAALGSAPAAATLTARRTLRSRVVPREFDLYRLLRKAVVRLPGKRGRRLAIADSKALYKSGLGLGQLERGVLAALAVVRGSGTLPANTMGAARWAATALELIGLTGADEGERRGRCEWNFHDDMRLPVEAEATELERLVKSLEGACRSSGVTLMAVRARLVFAEEFNELVEHFGNKGAALSHVTLALVRALVDGLPTGEGAGPIVIYLDKHGGRNRYAALLQHHFDECWIQPTVESRAESRYEWELGDLRVEAVFRVGCEALLPTALASMTAKYHRELSMRAFNAYWGERVQGLRPTAGYFGDSRRFKREIGTMQKELGIDDRMLWRCR
jgi:ribonuclease HII